MGCHEADDYSSAETMTFSESDDDTICSGRSSLRKSLTEEPTLDDVISHYTLPIDTPRTKPKHLTLTRDTDKIPGVFPSPLQAGMDLSTISGSVVSDDEKRQTVRASISYGDEKSFHAKAEATDFYTQRVRTSISEPVTMDLSSYSTTTHDSACSLKDEPFTRRGTFESSLTEQTAPQPDWKPFWMRWPYLTTLIGISIILAAAQEYLCQTAAFGKQPLFTFHAPSELNTWDFFSFKYLPTGIAVVFGVLWQLTDFEVKRLEAFYQLSKDGGALAAESLNVDWVTFFNLLRPFKAVQIRHYAVAISSVATLMSVSLVPILQAASVQMSPGRAERERHPEQLKSIYISPVYSRLLTSVLLLVAMLGCTLLWQLQRRPSGLIADVKGIAGIAAMANRSHILMDFADMDTATPEVIHQTLKSHRYSLRNSSLAPEGPALSQADKDRYDAQSRTDNPQPLMLRLETAIPFIAGMAFFLILVPLALFTRVNALSFSAPWLLTVVTICIKLTWGTMETSIRMLEPFYILSKRHASPKVLTLDYTSMAFGWMPISAFLNGHVLVGLVGMGSVLAEILTVCITSFGAVAGQDFTSGSSTGNSVAGGEETLTSFWTSFALSMAILTYLCVVATVALCRRRHQFLPRQPSTISSVLAYIHQSKMLYDFVGTEKMSNQQMDERLGKINKTYGLGWFTGRDGQRHCGVDQEELLASYAHGHNIRDAIVTCATNWQHY